MIAEDSDSMESFIDSNGNRVVRAKPSKTGAFGRRKGKDGKERKKLGKTRDHFKGGFR